MQPAQSMVLALRDSPYSYFFCSIVYVCVCSFLLHNLEW